MRGCTKISPGCQHCYAETFAERFRGVPGHPYEQGFDLRLVPGKLADPLRWASAKRVFVNSMSDLFHEDVPDDYVERVVRRHAGRQLAHLPGAHQARGPHARPAPQPPPLGGRDAARLVGGERREPAARLPSHRRPARRAGGGAVPVGRAAVGRFGRHRSDRHRLGDRRRRERAGARPLRPEWAVNLRDHCAAAGVPFFFKQWGGVRKGNAGRTLDGRTHDAMPEATAGAVAPRAVRLKMVGDADWGIDDGHPVG